MKLEPIREPSFRAKLLDRIRYFNRRFFNPFSLSFAGRPYSFWSVILHTGRHSGKAYITPIITARQDDHFVIPLPYGQQVDWFKNIMAAGSCELIDKGAVYHVSNLEMIPIEEGVKAFPGWVQSRLSRLDSQQMLRLNQIASSEDSQDRYQAFTTTYPLSRGLWVLAVIAFLAVGIGHRITRRN